mmetsp:Transcript_75814/g.214350  ORF Transcript_75814/g.214350 Transcript_75814/m.214350 type:complete len:396 (+) Transcript_75814:87-1274(+)
MSHLEPEWQDLPYGDGDPYRQVDDVYRGISMAPLPPGDCESGTDFVLGGMSLMPPEPHSTFKGFTDVDACYHEPDNFLKGICMGGGPDDELPMALPMPSCLDGFGAFDIPAKGLWMLDAANDHCTDAPPPSFEQFTESHHPPNLPTDNFFKLQTTTIHLATTAPFQLGNRLLEFFGGESALAVKSSIVKVRHEKFAIKADVFHGGFKCTVKARVYQEECAKYAIELQKRSGDCVAFNKTYQSAARYLESHFPADETNVVSELPRLEVEGLPQQEGENGTQSFRPFLDMADLDDQPALQAEAAVALAGAAMQDHLVASLYTDEVLETLKKLLNADCIDICYPGACMLSSLARHPEAVPRVQQNEALVQIIHKKMESQATSALVQNELAHTWGNLCG